MLLLLMYACFSYVEEGMDIVDAICAMAKDTDGNGLIAVDKQSVITIEETTSSYDGDRTN